jgi:hypothetical protein
MALQRAQNAMAYLTKSKGIDPQRIQVKAGTEPGRKVDVWTLPAGATLPGNAPAQPQGTIQPQGTVQPQEPAQPAAQPPADQPAATPQPTPPPQI